MWREKGQERKAGGEGGREEFAKMPSHGSLQRAVKVRPRERRESENGAGLVRVLQPQTGQRFSLGICGVNRGYSSPFGSSIFDQDQPKKWVAAQTQSEKCFGADCGNVRLKKTSNPRRVASAPRLTQRTFVWRFTQNSSEAANPGQRARFKGAAHMADPCFESWVGVVWIHVHTQPNP